jgi:hypothetical protein
LISLVLFKDLPPRRTITIPYPPLEEFEGRVGIGNSPALNAFGAGLNFQRSATAVMRIPNPLKTFLIPNLAPCL